MKRRDAVHPPSIRDDLAPEAKLDQDPLTLAFVDPRVERSFLAAYAKSSRRWYRAVSGWLLAIWLGFAPVDMLLDGSFRVAAIRLTASIPVFAAFFFSWASPATFERWSQRVLALGFAGPTLSCAAMAFVLREPARTKDLVLGMCLALLIGHTLIPLRFVHATIVSAIGIAAWAGSSAINTPSRLEFTANLAWVACATGIGMLGSRSLERHRRREFVQNRDLESERQRTERLLLNVLPELIARRLHAGESHIADTFEEVTVLFGDLVGFTALSAKLEPAVLVRTLDELFSAFDDIAQRHGLEKIKTIGDACMVVGGLPSKRADHAHAIADMALEMRDLVASYRLEGPEGDRRGQALEMRIGIHTGPVVAGVIGKRKFIYDLWGDTVNTASRMESHGVTGAIQVSEATGKILESAYVLEARGEIEIKGKGLMATYLLRERRGRVA